MGRKDFDRDGAVKACVAGAVDFSHPARAESRKDLVWAKLGAWKKWHKVQGL
jgi:hypothetical protein